MGYCMSVKSEDFRIKAENVGKAIQAIKALDTKTGRDSYSWVSNGFSKKGTLYDIMYEWCWAPEMNYNEHENELDAFGIGFAGDKMGEDQVLFDAIAPYVVPGSYIEMVGEDGSIWRWYFDGKTCEEQSAEVGYNDGSVEQVDYKQKHTDILSQLSTWAKGCRDIDKRTAGVSSIDRKEVADILDALVEKHK